MPILRDFERRLGNLVEGFFATTFRSGLQPVELAKRVLREMDAARTVGLNEVWAPNHFVFSLSQEDSQRFEQAEQALAHELKQVVRDAAAERGWGLVGPPEIVFEVDEGLGRGKFRCRASLVEGEPEPPPARAADRPTTVPGGSEASLTVTEEGAAARGYRLGAALVTIGRLPECDVVLTDPAASRRHASIRAQGGGHLLTDLGSTNGTFVNDEPVGERWLQDGDRITIGSAVLEFRRR